MFPTGRPGVALLLMRVGLAIMLMDGVSGRLLDLGSVWFLLAPGVVAVALCLGFLTPVVAALTVLLEVATWATAGGTIGAVHVCAVLDAIALGLLGPGSYSLDARLFGRRQIVLRGRDDDSRGT
jgi:hypothetical protein